ncbi:MAG TPA: CotH kinase family protein, partial [Verrucomicrobiae bacterium]|nr:CotH kinase family protein [Verrucomicrobiae bacterium]
MNPILHFRPFALVIVSLALLAGTSRAYDLIPLGAPGWKYVIATQEVSAPISAWRANGYDDAGWSTGQTPIGYTTGGTLTGYEGSIATVLRTSASTPTWTSVYFRKSFVVTNLSGIAGLTLNVYVDDGAVAWINGVEVGRAAVNAGDLAYNAQATIVDEERLLSVFITDLSSLVVGTNTLAIHGFNGPTTSSDFHVQASLTTVDDNAPTVEPDPPPNAIVTSLPFVTALFSENVTGVNASDLLINGAPATNMVMNNPNDYTFYFPSPPTGTVSLAWAASHGIADVDATPTPFGGGSWTITLDPNAITGLFVISEFMAQNDNGISDEDGDRQDWIEIFNPGAVDSSLAGWYLTDVAGSNKWRFPSHINMTLGPNQYLRVWASNKNRTNNIARLHTNFQLARGGEYLALRDPEGRVVSEFAPTYEEQFADVSYGRDRVDPNIIGFFTTPTPGAQNSTSGANFAPALAFSVDDGVFTNDSIQVAITIPNPPAGTFQIRYTLDGNEPTNNSPLYTGPLTFGTNVFVKARVFASTPGMFPGPVTAKAYFFLDASVRDFNSNLPIVIMNTSGRSIAQNVLGGGIRTKGSVAIINTFRGRASIRGEPDFIGMAQLEVFGQTSAGFAKQPFNIELNDAYGNDTARSLLGMPEEADWKMRNPFSDKCLMNDFLAYELYEDMGNYSVRRRNVEVFICANAPQPAAAKISFPGSYYGVLCFLEKIERDDNRVDVEELTPANTTEPEIAGGYIVKKDKDSGGDRNFTVNGGAGHVAQTIKMHEPKPRDVTTAQVNWIQNYLNRMTEAMYATDWLTRTGTNHYSNYLDVDSWVDQHWIVEFTKQIDGYRISNFMSKKRHGKLTMSPIWDWNLAFGNANYLEGGRTNGWYWNHQGEGMDSNNHIWLRRLLYGIPNIIGTGGAGATSTAVMNSGDPDFIQKVIDRWGVLRTNVFNGDRVIARIDEIAAELTDGGQFTSTNTPAARNFIKYPNLTTP